MVYRLSVVALLKYKLPFLDIKIAGLSKRVIEKNLKLNIIKDAGSSYRRPFYCVSSPVEQNQEFATLYKFHI
jgi:hypothetical protein